jgi:NADPH-dependent F420 reductase
MQTEKPIIAVIGGTGNLGLALGRRWARSGYPVIIGSRDGAKAAAAAGTIAAEPGVTVQSGTNSDAAQLGEIIVVTVPFGSQAAILEEIRPWVAGKLVVDTTVPLVPPKVARVQLPQEGSAAQRAQSILGGEVMLVAAFHNVAAHKLASEAAIDCDVLVFGDQKEPRARVVALADAIGLRGIHGGPLANSAAAEALTSVLIMINKTYKADGAGIRITGGLGAVQD